MHAVSRITNSGSLAVLLALLRAKYSDINFNRRELKVPETKNGKIHYVPLSTVAMSILESLPRVDGNPYILPGGKKGQHLANIEKPWQRVRRTATASGACDLTDVRLHDLRRTVGSWLAQNGSSLHLIGKVLNHSSQATTAVYARFAENSVRDALESHSAQLMSVAGDFAPVKAASSVVPFTRKSSDGPDNAISRSDIAKFHGELGLTYPYTANRALENFSKMFELA